MILEISVVNHIGIVFALTRVTLVKKAKDHQLREVMPSEEADLDVVAVEAAVAEEVAAIQLADLDFTVEVALGVERGPPEVVVTMR
jgi:hypothetical protein